MTKKAHAGLTMGNLRSTLLFGSVLSLMACNSACNRTTDPPANGTEVPAVPAVVVPAFSADSAYRFVEEQVAFGPRVPNTAAHEKCAQYLSDKFTSYGAEVMVQQAKVRAYNGTLLNMKNIIASYNPEQSFRVLLCAHWDSRHVADQDEERKNEPILGANDGGSGVAVLLEIARQLQAAPIGIGVDIILFDTEDYGQPEADRSNPVEDSWCLGSQYWSANPHKLGYRANYGILLDMVGAANATFLHDEVSMYNAPFVVDKVWKQAAASGFGNYFVNARGGSVIDDHYYVNKIARIPCIDIIHYDPQTPSRFFKHWHTHKDDMSNIDRATLRAVGQTVLEVIYREKPAQ